jgi:hypothetical protein
VREFIDAHPDVDPVSAGRARLAGLRVVEPAVAADELPAPEPTGPVRVVPSFGGAVAEPLANDAEALPEPSFAGPGGQSDYAPIDARPAVAESEDELLPEDPPIEETIDPAEPADATPSEHDATESDPLVESDGEAEIDIEPDPRAKAGGQLLWNGLIVVAVGLAVFALIITLMALAGVERIF